MKSLTQTEKRVLNPACPPGMRGLYALTAGLVITLIAVGVPVVDVALLLGAAAISVIAMANPAATTRITGTIIGLIATVLALPAGTVLARLAAAAGPRAVAPTGVAS